MRLECSVAAYMTHEHDLLGIGRLKLWVRLTHADTRDGVGENEKSKSWRDLKSQKRERELYQL